MSDRGVTILIPITTIVAIALGYTTARIIDLRAQVEVQGQALRTLGRESERQRRRLYLIR